MQRKLTPEFYDGMLRIIWNYEELCYITFSLQSSRFIFIHGIYVLLRKQHENKPAALQATLLCLREVKLCLICNCITHDITRHNEFLEKQFSRCVLNKYFTNRVHLLLDLSTITGTQVKISVL